MRGCDCNECMGVHFVVRCNPLAVTGEAKYTRPCMQFSVDCDVHSVLQQVSFAEVACYILM